VKPAKKRFKPSTDLKKDTNMKKLLASLALGLGLMIGGTAAMAQAPAAAPAASAPAAAEAKPADAAAPAAAAAAAAPAAAAAAAPAPVPNKGDTAWMITATLLVVIFMATARSGPVLWRHGPQQEHAVGADAGVGDLLFCSIVLWAVYGYSLAFTDGNAFIGGSTSCS
jgi:Amt family ammonium transporter